MTGSTRISLADGLAHATRSHIRAAVLLLMVALLLFLPGFFTLPPMDRDEPRFAQASRQMIETGDYIAIRFQDEARNKKPVGIYWLQAGAVQAGAMLGVPEAQSRIWLYRLPSLLGAIGTVLLTYWAALAFMSRQNAFVAAMLMASTLLLGVEARLAKTDAMVALTVVAAMGALARLYLRGDKSLANAAIFWTAVAAGILVKGPITPMIPAFAAVALSLHARSARWLLPLRPWLGLGWCAVIAAPWLVLIYLKTNGTFFADAIGGDMLGKVAGAKEAHGAPPLTYFVVFWLTAWPMAPFAALAAPFVARHWRTPTVAFVLAWLVPGWVLFELVPTKLPHYVLPLYPAIAIAIGLAREKAALDFTTRWRRVLGWMVPGVALLVPMLVLGANIWLRTGFVWQFAVAGLVMAGLASLTIRALRNGTFAAVLAITPALALGLAVLAYSTVLTTTSFATFALSPRLAQARAVATAAGKCSALAPATTGYREPSLVFLTTTDLVMTTGEGAAQFMDAAPCRIAFVDRSQEAAFAGALRDKTHATQTARVAGINLNGGKALDIGVYVRQEGGP